MAISARIRLLATLVVGVGLVGSSSMAALIDVEGIAGTFLLLSPWLLFTLVARVLRPWVWLTFLALLAASTVFGLSAATSSSTGALIFLWLLPAQWALSWMAAYLPGALSRGAEEGPG